MHRKIITCISAVFFATAALSATAGAAMAGTVHPAAAHPAAGCDTHKCYF
jgi:hypothetical protein